MQKRAKKVLSLALAMLLTLGVFMPQAAAAAYVNDSFSYPSAPSGYSSLSNYKSGSVGVHDTEFLYDSETDTYYAYITNSSNVYKSTDLVNWTSAGSRNGSAWAPCIIKLATPITYGGTDYMYAAYDASSSFGTRDSQIRLFLSNSPYAGFVQVGSAIVSSGSDTTQDFNAIDPKAFYAADGTLWMSFGSWFGGIYVVELDPATGYPFDIATAVRICYRNINHAAIEGSTIIYNADTGYYYLMASYGDLDDTYNARVGRSDSVTGPYFDYNGNNMNNTTTSTSDNNDIGTKITGPYSFEYDAGWYSQGHSSWIYNSDTNQYFVSTNARAGDVSGTKLTIRQVVWTDDGWPVVGPEQYVPGEVTTQTVASDEIEGTYDIIAQLRDDLPFTTDRSDCQYESFLVNLTSGGDITYQGENAGTWEQTGENKIAFTLDGVNYTVYAYASWDWENWCPSLVFTGLSEAGALTNDYAGIEIWGKKISAEHAAGLVDTAGSNLSLQSTARSDLIMPEAYYDGIAVSWESGNTEIIGNDGSIVARPAENTAVTMTATLSLGAYSVTKDFEVTVFAAVAPPQEDPVAEYRFSSAAALLTDSTGGDALSATGTAVYSIDDIMCRGAVKISGGGLSLPVAVANAETFSFASWVRLDSNTSTAGTLFSFAGADTSMALYPKDANGFITFSAAAGGVTSTVQSGAGIMPGDWAYVVLTLSGNTATIYINGQAVGSSNSFSIVPADIQTTAALLAVAECSMDSAQFYNRALSASEIEGNYDAVAGEKFVGMACNSLNVAAGETAALTAGVYHFEKKVDIGEYTVVYTSDNTDVATVNSATGAVTGVSAGVAVITASVSGVGSAACSVNVVESAVNAESVTLSSNALTGKTLQSVQLAAAVSPAGTTQSIVTWSSSDSAVATVNSFGRVSFVGAGTATITATVDGTSIAADCAVTVTESLLVRYDFDGDLEDSSGNDKPVTTAAGSYSYGTGAYGESYDKAVSIDTVAAGTAHVLRLPNNLAERYTTGVTISIWVNPSALTAHTAVFFSQGSSRWMSIVPCSVDTGTPTVRICNDSNSTWSDITSGQALPLDQWSLLTYTFAYAQGSTSANYGVAKLYANGELVAARNDCYSPFNSSNQAYYIGGNPWDKSFDGSLDDFRMYSTVLSAEEVMNIYQEAAVEANHPAARTVTAAAGDNGTISPASATVRDGGNQTFSIMPGENYIVHDVLVGGVSVGAPLSYALNNISADMTISAEFTAGNYITATAGSGGSISPEGDVAVLTGQDQTFTITANAGYVIGSVLVDGESIEITDTSAMNYLFEDVTEAHTIAASFKALYTVAVVAGSGGSVTPTSVTVPDGTSVSFTTTPDEGYMVDRLTYSTGGSRPRTYDVTDQITDDVFTTTVSAARTYNLTFKRLYDIEASAGYGGTITPAGVTTVAAGEDQSYTITAAHGYYISDVYVDGVPVGHVKTYTFEDVSSAHTIRATFAQSQAIDSVGIGLGNAQEGKPVSIYTQGTETAISSDALSKIIDNGGGVGVATKSGSIGLSNETLGALHALGAGNLEIVVGSVEKTDAGASPVFEIGGEVFDVSVYADGIVQHDISGQLTLKVSSAKAGDTMTVVHYLAGGGTEILKVPVTEDGKVTFSFSSLSYFVVLSEDEVPAFLVFSDVDADDWFAGAVGFVVDQGLFEGTSDTAFSPDARMTRAMLATVLHRQAGKPGAEEAAMPADVTAGSWYCEAARWTEFAGIMPAADSGLFGADDSMTREDVVVFLYRYAQFAGYDVSVGDEDILSSFGDAALVSGFAADAMKWAVDAGIITGTKPATLSPEAMTTRAQVATILMRFTEAMDK